MLFPLLIVLLLGLSCSSSKGTIVYGEDTELRDQLRRNGKKEVRNSRQSLRHKGRLKGQIAEIPAN